MDSASLLQAAPKSSGGRKLQAARNPQDKRELDPLAGIKEDFENTHLCGKATDFEQYPCTYPDDIFMPNPMAESKKAEPSKAEAPKAESKKAFRVRPTVAGHVLVSSFKGLTPASSGAMIKFNIVGADPYCYHGPFHGQFAGKKGDKGGTGHADSKKDAMQEAMAKKDGRKFFDYAWEKSCRIEIREAASCSSIGDLGDSWFNPNLRNVNPWECVHYTSEEVHKAKEVYTGRAAEEARKAKKVYTERAAERASDDVALLDKPDGLSGTPGRRAIGGEVYSAQDTVIVYTGSGPESLMGKAVIVYDFFGFEMACAPIVTHGHGMSAAQIQRPPPSLVAAPGHASARVLRASKFAPYGPEGNNFDVWGEVYIQERMGSTPATYGQVLSWDLEGIDGRCDKGTSGMPHSCGIHVMTGTSCQEGMAGSTYWDTYWRYSNPWPCVTYTAAIGTTPARIAKTIGQGVPAYSGYTSSDIIQEKKVLLVYDYHGNTIACSKIGLY